MRYLLILIATLSVSCASYAEKFVYIHKHMLVTDEGNVYSIDTGYADDGPWESLGKEFYLGRKPGPFLGKVEFLKDIKKIIVAKAAFIALTNDGEVYTWGVNQAKLNWASSHTCGGFLGINRKFIAKPKKVNFDDSRIIDISWDPCSDIVALNKEGEAFIWGSGSPLNDKIPDYASLPKKLLVSKKIVSASSEVFVTKDGGIYYFGDGVRARGLKTLLPKCEKFICFVAEKNAHSVSAFSEVRMLDGIVHFPDWKIKAGKVDNECVIAFYNYSYLSCEGDIYRAGVLARHKGWLSSSESKYVEEFEWIGEYQNVAWFTREAFLTVTGDVWVYGSDELGEGILPLYREALIDRLDYYDFDDLDFLISYHKIIDSAVLNGGLDEY